MHTIRDLVLSLAGVFQATSLVKQIATTGLANSALIESSIETLFKFDADSVEEVYGGLAGVGSGVRVLNDQFENKNDKRDLDITNYVISLLILERKVSANTSMLEKISNTLETIQSQLEYFSLMHENTIAKIGELYKDTISTIQPRIIINGEQPHLSNKININKVRALLLAGIRSAILWRQCGGSRWHILFKRKKYITENQKIIAEL